MNSRALALAVILLLGTALSEVSARSIDKRHVRRDWLIIPDTIAFSIYSFVNGISKEAGEILAEIGKNQIILDIRNYLIKTTANISKVAEEVGKIIEEEIKRIQREVEEEKRKAEQLNQEKAEPQVAQEN